MSAKVMSSSQAQKHLASAAPSPAIDGNNNINLKPHVALSGLEVIMGPVGATPEELEEGGWIQGGS